MEIGRRSSRQACCSTRGRRTVNEDRAATLVLGGGTYVVAVADGMGGAVAGDVASEAAMSAFLGAMRASGAEDAYGSLCAAFEAADAAVRGAVTPGREGMGTTLVAAVARGTDIWIGNVGDSRAVLVLPDEIVRLSTEHSLVSEALRSGRMTELEALRSPERHVLSRALGDGDARPDVGYHPLHTHPGATRAMLLVGSDGLFNFVGETEVLEISAEERRASGAVERLVRRAIENGSDDNVSAAALVLDVRPSRRRGPMWAAAVLALLAVATAAYSTGREIVNRIAAVRGAAPPPATARVRLPVIRGQTFKGGDERHAVHAEAGLPRHIEGGGQRRQPRRHRAKS
jgi:serine/threonine protein phosphatase PrpC